MPHSTELLMGSRELGEGEGKRSRGPPHRHHSPRPASGVITQLQLFEYI